MTIIHIEGDCFFAEGVRQVFALHETEVVHMSNPQTAVTAIIDSPPDVVLLDLRFTALNGFEILALLKADQRTCHIPLMIWSQLASREDIQRCFDLGACEYFVKGQHQPREVITCIKRRLEK